MADTATYEPIATTTLSSATTYITFSSIPNTYTDLILIGYAKNTSGPASACLKFNGDGNNSYSDQEMSGNGSSVGGGENTNSNVLYCGNSWNNWGVFKYQINSYANTSFYKNVLGNTYTAGYTAFVLAGQWRNTSAINQIQWFNAGGPQWDVGTQVTLYGIKCN